MSIDEAIKNYVVFDIELHSFFFLIIIFLFINMFNSYKRNNKKIDYSLVHVYIASALMVASDCVWSTVSTIGSPSLTMCYVINLVYFFGSSSAAACWFVYCLKQHLSKIPNVKVLYLATLIPYLILLMLYFLSPAYHYIFSIENRKYVRGSVFYLDPIIKMLYVTGACVLSLICGLNKKIKYLQKKDFNFVLFGIPVLVCGILQVITGYGFNCLGVTFGLVLIYATGISNQDSANTDAIYSLANSFEASYIVNIDTGLIRPLHKDTMHDATVFGMTSTNFTEHFQNVLSKILLPEDKHQTLEDFSLTNVEKRFQVDNSFTIRYRVKVDNGQTEIHMAYFIHALGSEGRREFLLGINSLHSDSLLYERNESLSRENKKLEQINLSIIESVAKIVEARDSGSGEHIVRVKKYTEIIARRIMMDYPEYNLDEEGVKLISSASVLHDVGKIVIPDRILLKPGKLTDDEFEIMKTHSTKGCDVLNLFPLGLDDAFLDCALSICRWHHEKYDGKGYPDGLKGDEIPISAQIVSVADCYDALTSERTYKKAYSPEKAFEMIINGECGNFSPKILDVLNKQKGKIIEFTRLHK